MNDSVLPDPVFAC